ncbi:hypothetical protein HHO41_11905 [Bacillus sp. DNRA2]|uniref:hypothetical protein n=1 Tax=Bacillus sp. DNRA2 TaxID=2723053 RepID=UPI00145C952D|nr:hypothetical protein [Bacillus sp. DNRA2]NMD71000.1 hypothetical protein [Bacillus sp. DNRA2]
MSAFIRYQLTSFIRSLKFIPPTTLFLAWVFILYAYNNAPILSSYGVSSIGLYITMTWMTMALFSLEEDSEKHMLFFQLGRKLNFLIGKWLSLLIVMIPLIIYGMLYPIIGNLFKGELTLNVIGLSIFSHLVFQAFGILVGTLFSSTNFSIKKYAWITAVLVIVVSLASTAMIERLPILKWVLWLFPPVFKIINHMEGEDMIVLLDSLGFDILWVVCYITLGIILTIFLFRKKEQ